uniref:Uncharacterized protein n=1 Tax=Arundo donax TaxID=35708 RepID=A0A0A9DQ20_ARUDO
MPVNCLAIRDQYQMS